MALDLGAGYLNLSGISADGRYVSFVSASTDLVNWDTNSQCDIFQRDRALGQTELVSISTSGQQGNGDSLAPQCSRNGRLVVFESRASNLVIGDANSSWDVFVRDTLGGTTERVSVDSNGVGGNGDSNAAEISPDGRFVAFHSGATNLVVADTNASVDIFVHDRLTRRTARVSESTGGVEGDAHSTSPLLSRYAGKVVFSTPASTLVPNDTNNTSDVYARECPLPTLYCAATTNSLGCVPWMTTDGVPMASWPTGFYLGARRTVSQKSGMLIYSTAGSASLPFHGGTLCVQQPLQRTPAQQSGGSTAGMDCTGALVFDFNAWIATGVDPALVASTSVWAQYWSRDPGFAPPNNASLSDAVSFVIWP